MMRRQVSMLLALLFCFTLFVNLASASWAYPFIVNKGNVYVITDEQIDPSQIGKNIGKVTKYSDREGTYSGNFSNRYPKGTQYYEIKGIEPLEAIAIKESGDVYVKAVFERGGYPSDSFNWMNAVPFIFAAIGLIAIYLLYVYRRKN